METFLTPKVSTVPRSIYLCFMENEKDQILLTISSLFYKYGIKSVSMDDISRELGISKKTLYTIFKDKNELVDKVVANERKFRKQEIEHIRFTSENAIEAYVHLLKIVREIIESYNPSYVYDLKKYYPNLYKREEKIRVSNMFQLFKQNIERGISEGLFRDNIKVDIIIKFHVTTILSLDSNLEVNKLFTDKELLDYRTYYEYYVFFMRGIVNHKGYEYLEQKIKTLELN